MISQEELEKYFPIKGKAFTKYMLAECLQYKILEIIFMSEIGPKLSFIGGTALRIIYGTSRFSEDIDLDNFNLKFKDFEKVANKVKQKLEQEGYPVEIESYPIEKTFHYLIKIPEILFDYKVIGHKNQKLKIKVDTESYHFKYEPEIKIIKKFGVFSNIKVAPVDILLSQKIGAFLTRKTPKGRDMYDVAFLSSITKPNYKYLDKRLKISNVNELKEKLLSKYKSLNIKNMEADVINFLFYPEHGLKALRLFADIVKTSDW